MRLKKGRRGKGSLLGPEAKNPTTTVFDTTVVGGVFLFTSSIYWLVEPTPSNSDRGTILCRPIDYDIIHDIRVTVRMHTSDTFNTQNKSSPPSPHHGGEKARNRNNF